MRAIGPDLIEADVHYFHGRLEVRHAKTLGPLRVLWDRNPWRLVNPFAHQLTLEELLGAAAPDEELMLDLKGIDNSIVEPVIQAVETHLPGRPVTVCSQNWQILPRFAERPWARVIYSVGRRSHIRAIFSRIDHADGVAIDHTLLRPSLAQALREHVPLLITWTVDDPLRWAELASWGVNGVITDDAGALKQALGSR